MVDLSSAKLEQTYRTLKNLDIVHFLQNNAQTDCYITFFVDIWSLKKFFWKHKLPSSI